ncbi:MAG: hypothetical protein GY926_04600 [bacterium]|nr:hypothetical protein [bacterium]MCP4964495.1 hypothetical protein [bacterium]
MTRNWKRAFYGLLAVALLVTAVPVAAVAQTETEQPPRTAVELTDEQRTDRLEAAKERVTAQIDRRLTALDRLAGKIDKDDHISDGHAATLLADIDAARSVLQAGIDAVAAVETVAEVREVAPPIFETTLVFALLGPNTHAVAASDGVAAATRRFTEIGPNLQDALDRLDAAGVDTAEAQADLDEMTRLIAAAATGAGPVADSVIGLQPSDWPDPAQSTLAAAKTALQEARSHLRAARDLGKQVSKFIRSSSSSGE